MLKFMRLHTKRIFITVLLLIIPAFCFFGIDMAIRSANSLIAGKIYGKSVKIDKFSTIQQEARTQTLAQLILLFGLKSVDQLGALQNQLGDFFSRQNLNQLTWERLLLSKLADKQNIKVHRGEIIQWISHFPLFQSEGKFNPHRYESVLRSSFGTSSITFEKQLKTTLQILRLQQSVTSGIEPTKEELEKAYAQKNEKVAIECVLIDGNNFWKSLKTTNEELKSFYENNKELFRRPEEIEVNYFFLSQSDLEKNIIITEDQIKIFYESNKVQFKDETTQLEKPLSEVKEMIQALLKNRMTQELFYEQATDLSIALIQNPIENVAKEFNLNLQKTPFFSKNKSPLPSEVTEKIFALAKGEISNPISLNNQVYFVQVTDKKEAFIAEFADCVPDVAQAWKQKEGNLAALEKAKAQQTEMAKLMKLETIPFAEAVKKAKLPLQKLPPFSREENVSLLPREAQIVAFQLKENEVSPVFVTSSGALFFAVTDKEIPLYQETPQLVAALKNEKQSRYYQIWLTERKEEANLVDLTPFIY